MGRFLDFSEGLLNLLTTIDNGQGATTNVEYTYASNFEDTSETSPTVLPFPLIVIKKIYETAFGSTSSIREERFEHRGGYYDGTRNDFRGFNLVDKIEVGDHTIGSLLTRFYYEQGRTSQTFHEQLLLRKRLQRKLSRKRKHQK